MRTVRVTIRAVHGNIAVTRGNRWIDQSLSASVTKVAVDSDA